MQRQQITLDNPKFQRRRYAGHSLHFRRNTPFPLKPPYFASIDLENAPLPLIRFRGGYYIFEPTHGSAPKYENLDPSIVNPIAMIMSACMMLDHIDETEKATKIRNAVAKIVEEGKIRAYDMLKLRGCQEVLEQGAASTTEMTDAVIAALQEIK